MTKRLVYTSDPNNCGVVKDNLGKVFAVIGPFENFSADVEVMDALERLLKDWNKKVVRNI